MIFQHTAPVIGRGGCGDAESFVHSGEDGELDVAGYEALHEGTNGAGGVGADHEAVSDVVAVAAGAVPGPVGLGQGSASATSASTSAGTSWTKNGLGVGKPTSRRPDS